MAESIFINYRRGEDQAAAGRLYDQLEASFTRERIFIDVDNIAPGLDFTEELAIRVEQCDVFLAVVGKRWADVVDVDGSRRLDNPNDWVRVEIESAQRLGKHIIPVLVDGAEMPRPEKLPEALQPFARRNAARLTHERFRADVQALVVAIGRLREAERARFEAERAQTPPVAETLAVSTPTARRRITPLAIAALASLAVIAAGAGLFAWRSSSPSPVATGALAERAGVGALSVAKPAPTKIASAAPTSTPAAKVSPDASPSGEAKLNPIEAQPTPSAAPTVAASSAPTPAPAAAAPLSPAATLIVKAPPTLEAKASAVEAQSTPSAANSAAPPHETKFAAVEAQPTPSATPTVAASPAPPPPEPTPEASAPPSLATTEIAKAPPTLQAKVSAIESAPTPSTLPTVAASPAAVSAATPPASPLATANPDVPPPREAKAKADAAPPTPSPVSTVVASPIPTAVNPPPPATVATSEPQLALAAPAAKPVGADLAALAPLVAVELRRLGCYDGAATVWDAVDLRLGVDKFAQLAKLATLPAEPDVGLLAALRSEPDHFCSPQCSPREVASDGRCVPKTCGPNQVLTHEGACVARQPKPQPTTAARAAAPTAGKRCFTFNGSSYCE